MKNSFSLFVVLPLLLFVSLGCGSKTTTVSGVIEYDDKPVQGAEVTFGPTFGEQKTTTDANGRFTISASSGYSKMLRLEVKGDCVVLREKIEFPAFYPPEKELKPKMVGIIGCKRKK